MEVIKIQKEDKLLERIQESLEPEIYPEIQKKRPKILPKIVPSTNKKVNRDLVKKVGVINNSLISFDNIILKKEPKLEKNDLIVKHCKSDIYNIIIHMSDIHIEPNNRIEEYSYVLDDTVTKVAQFCKKYEKILIVITGDILDKKETIKSQGLMLCRKFFQHLAQLGTVVIIAGNHDINEKNIQSYSEEISIKNKNINISRCDDPLTVVSDNLPIFYLQFTGLYEFGDIIFCVSSLCDRKFIKYENIPNIRKDKKYVSLYHGIVSGAIDDNNNLIISSNLSSSRYKNLTDFKNFDAVLLGDIHRTQFLDDNRTIAYAG
ncbi:MAG: metallophosphoesterase, partial [Ignavibacteriae bacterium]|nr:metallophosphoesterase [Ignavibacteriota bacterium]